MRETAVVCCEFRFVYRLWRLYFEHLQSGIDRSNSKLALAYSFLCELVLSHGLLLLFSYTFQLLHTVEILGPLLDHHLHLFIPGLIRLCDPAEDPSIRHDAILAMGRLCNKVSICPFCCEGGTFLPDSVSFRSRFCRYYEGAIASFDLENRA